MGTLKEKNLTAAPCRWQTVTTVFTKQSSFLLIGSYTVYIYFSYINIFHTFVVDGQSTTWPASLRTGGTACWITWSSSCLGLAEEPLCLAGLGVRAVLLRAGGDVETKNLLHLEGKLLGRAEEERRCQTQAVCMTKMKCLHHLRISLPLIMLILTAITTDTVFLKKRLTACFHYSCFYCVEKSAEIHFSTFLLSDESVNLPNLFWLCVWNAAKH